MLQLYKEGCPMPNIPSTMLPCGQVRSRRAIRTCALDSQAALRTDATFSQHE